MSQKWDRKIVLTLNARNEHDRSKFVEDLRESVAEMDEMEALRLEAELEKQRLSVAGSTVDNRDSGIADGNNVTVDSTGNSSDVTLSSSSRHNHHAANGNGVTHNGVVLRKSAINNSLLDLADSSEKMARRGSVGSLDSGMSISFQSNSVGSMCLPTGSVDPRHCYHNHNHYHRGPGGGSDKRLYHS
jgi:IQ motif/SEC7 domain-containing protein